MNKTIKVEMVALAIFTGISIFTPLNLTGNEPPKILSHPDDKDCLFELMTLGDGTLKRMRSVETPAGNGSNWAITFEQKNEKDDAPRLALDLIKLTKDLTHLAVEDNSPSFRLHWIATDDANHSTIIPLGNRNFLASAIAFPKIFTAISVAGQIVPPTLYELGADRQRFEMTRLAAEITFEQSLFRFFSDYPEHFNSAAASHQRDRHMAVIPRVRDVRVYDISEAKKSRLKRLKFRLIAEGHVAEQERNDGAGFRQRISPYKALWVDLAAILLSSVDAPNLNFFSEHPNVVHYDPERGYVPESIARLQNDDTEAYGALFETFNFQDAMDLKGPCVTCTADAEKELFVRSLEWRADGFYKLIGPALYLEPARKWIGENLEKQFEKPAQRTALLRAVLEAIISVTEKIQFAWDAGDQGRKSRELTRINRSRHNEEIIDHITAALARPKKLIASHPPLRLPRPAVPRPFEFIPERKVSLPSVVKDEWLASEKKYFLWSKVADGESKGLKAALSIYSTVSGELLNGILIPADKLDINWLDEDLPSIVTSSVRRIGNHLVGLATKTGASGREPELKFASVRYEIEADTGKLISLKRLRELDRPADTVGSLWRRELSSDGQIIVESIGDTITVYRFDSKSGNYIQTFCGKGSNPVINPKLERIYYFSQHKYSSDPHEMIVIDHQGNELKKIPWLSDKELILDVTDGSEHIDTKAVTAVTHDQFATNGTKNVFTMKTIVTGRFRAPLETPENRVSIPLNRSFLMRSLFAYEPRLIQLWQRAFGRYVMEASLMAVDEANGKAWISVTRHPNPLEDGGSRQVWIVSLAQLDQWLDSKSNLLR